MGLDIARPDFSAQAFACFQQRLEADLQQLRALLERPGFGVGTGSIGAELELYLVNDQGRPVDRNIEIRAALGDPRLTLELNRYNLEYNLSPLPFNDQAFVRLAQELENALSGLNQAAVDFGAAVLPIGILPTLRRSDFGPRHMTGLCRFQMLTERLVHLRQKSLFRIDIAGRDSIHLRCRDLTLEGANTSFQLHYRVDPPRFAELYNAVQLVTPLVLAVAANSPYLLGRQLWQETRIPLFQRAIDGQLWQPGHLPLSRVDFGNGWVRRDAWELFAESACQHPVLLPVPEPQGEQPAGPESEAPPLYALRLQHGTVWSWNRVIYDPVDGGHLRIEMRALPAGPTVVDMVANAALLIGLAEALAPEMEDWMSRLPHACVRENFYAAAEHGLDARLIWPDAQGALQTQPAHQLVEALLERAAAGLRGCGVHSGEQALQPIRARVASRQNGARWQIARHARLAGYERPRQAMRRMVQEYMEHARANLPVGQWPLG